MSNAPYIFDNTATMKREYWHDEHEHPVFQVHAAYIQKLPAKSNIKPWGYYGGPEVKLPRKEKA